MTDLYEDQSPAGASSVRPGRFAAGTRARRWWVIAGVVAVMVFGGVWGTGAFDKLSGAAFTDPTSESVRAKELQDATFGRSDADVILIYTSPDKTVDDPAVSAAVRRSLSGLPRDLVAKSVGYYDTKAPAFVSHDQRSSYAVLQLTGGDDDAREAQFKKLRPTLTVPGMTVRTGGGAAVNLDISDRVGADIERAELISLPLVLLLLTLYFRNVFAALIPMLVGGFAILASFVLVRLILMVTDVSVFAINIVTLLGLGLAIDYGLILVSRYREERRKGLSPPDASATMLRTAGRTVVVSGITVTLALLGLLLFPQSFLCSMGLGGIAAVITAAVGSLLATPAMLAILGRRVDPRPQGRRGVAREGFYHRLATTVMARPVVWILGVLALLAVIASPVRHLEFGGIDERALPPQSPSRDAADFLSANFDTAAEPPASVVIRGSAQAAQAFRRQVEQVQGVTDVGDLRTSGSVSDFDVTYAGDPLAMTSREIVSAIRDLPVPSGATRMVSGPTATLMDLLSSLAHTLPYLVLIMVGSMFVLLLLAFQSVVLPIKAVLMNIATLTATLGAVVWIFQEGHLADQLAFTSTGTVEATQPILMLAIAFGLSMDYEVLILSRIREEYERTHDNTAAVARGLQNSASIITWAAVLLIVVIGAFSTSGVTFIKLIGVGMVVAIAIDATLVRSILVPATMRLLGDGNWWVPRPLRGVVHRFAIRE